MSQNRDKLIQLLIGNLTNVVVHKVLERAVKEETLRLHYDKESLVSFDIAKKYREKINPADRELLTADIEKIKTEIIKRVRKELELRIAKGYEGIDLNLIEIVLLEVLKVQRIFHPVLNLWQSFAQLSLLWYGKFLHLKGTDPSKANISPVCNEWWSVPFLELKVTL